MIRIRPEYTAVIAALRDNVNVLSKAINTIESSSDEGTLIDGNIKIHQANENISNILCGRAGGLLKKYS